MPVRRAGSTTTVQPSSRRSRYARTAPGPAVAWYKNAAPYGVCRIPSCSATTDCHVHDIRIIRSAVLPVKRDRSLRPLQPGTGTVGAPDSKRRIGEETGRLKYLQPAIFTKAGRRAVIPGPDTGNDLRQITRRDPPRSDRVMKHPRRVPAGTDLAENRETSR